MHFHFVAPVYTGDSITAQAMVMEIDPEDGRVLLECMCTNQDGKEVLRAEIRGFPGKFE
jgi:3-hydroxybutyryl-CoA dehydratase